MTRTRALFATSLYEASLIEAPDFARLNGDLEAASLMLAREDLAGRAWCRSQGYGGYTSYASLDDLPQRASVFDDLRRRLDKHVTSFAADIPLDLGPQGRLKLDSLWVSVIKPGGVHTGHIHPHSVISGTYYVAIPPGAGGLRLEDPRLPLMMAAPPRRPDASEPAQTFVTLTPEVGTLFLWESWLRHEVLANRAKAPRISVSFNYAWA
jgi:uncharacterized protein (TIGR02466 family)